MAETPVIRRRAGDGLGRMTSFEQQQHQISEQGFQGQGQVADAGYEFDRVQTQKSAWQTYKALLYVSVSIL